MRKSNKLIIDALNLYKYVYSKSIFHFVIFCFVFLFVLFDNFYFFYYDKEGSILIFVLFVASVPHFLFVLCKYLLRVLSRE
jgi:hypothetical protein